MNQSREKQGSKMYTDVSSLSAKLDGQTVTIRARLHASRAKGKQCFAVLRSQCQTVQCLVFVNENISKHMVKFVSKISKESIVDVTGKVVKSSANIEGCTKKDLELHALEVWVTSTAESQLPLQVSVIYNRVRLKDC